MSVPDDDADPEHVLAVEVKRRKLRARVVVACIVFLLPTLVYGGYRASKVFKLGPFGVVAVCAVVALLMTRWNTSRKRR